MEDIEALEKALKPKERAFAREYIRDFNATAAVLRAGYNQTREAAAVTGSRTLRKEPVRAYIDALLREKAEGAGASRESIIARLVDITQRCMSAEPVKEWDADAKEWVDSGEYKFDSRGATKALETLSKILGYDSPESAEESKSYAIGFESELDDEDDEDDGD